MIDAPASCSTTTPDLAALLSRMAALEAQAQGREERMRLLEEENRWLKAQLFGRSSEKSGAPAEQANPDQARLFNEAEALTEAGGVAASESITIPAHTRTARRGRKQLDAALPRVEVLHDLPEQHKHCAAHGVALVRFGEETSEQLDYQPARLRVIRHIRPKYSCPCCQHIAIAPAPAQLLPRSMASPALLAHIVTAKFADHLPLYRQERQFERLGVQLGRATMAGWMIRLGEAVQPVVNLLAEQMLAAPLIHCDETRLQVLRPDPASGKAPASDHWMWVRAAGPPGRRITLFDYDASRSGAVPKRLLQDYRGILLTDGYEPYEAVAHANGLTHAGCWAHVRRKFEEARKGQAHPGATASHAGAALSMIGELYGIERTLWDRDNPLSAEQRVHIRQQRSAPILAKLRTWLEALAEQALPQSQLGKAVQYTLGQWSKLTVFLAHGEAPLDNNRCENAIRPFVVGRKGWLFADTVAGAKASANLFSLVETARANGIEPHAYLSVLFERLPAAKTVEDIEALRPWSLKAEITALSHQPAVRKNAGN